MKRLKFVALATMISGAMALAACSSDNAKDTKSGSTSTKTEKALSGEVLLRWFFNSISYHGSSFGRIYGNTTRR